MRWVGERADRAHGLRRDVRQRAEDCGVLSTADKDQRMLNLIGTDRLITPPGISAGGGGNGCARRTSSSVSWSSRAEPELRMILLDVSRPLRSMLNASCAVPC